MKSCLITFLSQTQAARLKSMVKREGIPATMVQTPKALSYGGCTVALRCNKNDLGLISALCRRYGIAYSRVFQEGTDHNGKTYYEEISI